MRGIGPESWFPERSKANRSFIFSISKGIDLESVLLYIRRYFSFVSRPISAGIFPVNRLFWRNNDTNSVQLVIILGEISPKKELSDKPNSVILDRLDNEKSRVQ